MRVRTMQGLQTLRRAHHFLASHSFESAIGELTPHVDVLGGLLQQMTGHVAAAGHRSQMARVATDDKRSRGKVLLLQYLRPIARIASVVFADDDSAARAGFRLPRRRGAEELLQAADAFIEQCVQHEARFVAGGLAPDFVQRLRTATAAYRTAITAQGLVIGRRVAATTGMEYLLVRAREQLRVIDAMLTPELTSQPVMLAEWRSVSRFVRRGAEPIVTESDSAPADGAGSPAAGAGIVPVRPLATATAPHLDAAA